MKASDQEFEELKQFLNKIFFPILAIDWGGRRIGLAISDKRCLIATPYKLIEKTNKKTDEDIVHIIKNIVIENNVKSILLGIPKTNRTSQVKIYQFANILKKSILLPIGFWDESYSTVEAQNMLISSNQHMKKNKKKLDSLAASIFLQDFLNYFKRQNDKKKQS